MHKKIQLTLAMIWVPLLLILPALLWSQGTSRNVSVRVISEPYRASPDLVYEWSGIVYRACPIRLERHIVDASGYVHRLVDKEFPASSGGLGPTRFEVRVETPQNLPSGPAEYRVTERPACDWLQRQLPPRVEYPPVKFTVSF